MSASPPASSHSDTFQISALEAVDSFLRNDDDDFPTVPRDEQFFLKRSAARLSAALLHVAQQSTEKRRDRALAALIVLIYGPTPFGGANNIKDVALRYGMSERNLYQLIDTLRGILQPTNPVQAMTHEERLEVSA